MRCCPVPCPLGQGIIISRETENVIRRKNNKTPRENIRTLVIIFFIAGVFALVIGLVMDKNYRDLKNRCTAQTTGELVDIKSKFTSGRVSHMEYSGVYEYSPSENSYYQVNGIWSRSKEKTRIVKVMYDPDDPGKAYVSGALERGFIAYLFSGIAFTLCILIIVVLKTSRSPILAKDHDPNSFDTKKGPFI